MMSRKIERFLPFSAEQLFDLAADVERYPEFLRWWIAARIVKRSANTYYTDQVLGLGPISIKFTSKTMLHRPGRIDVTSVDLPFRQFALSWMFEPRPGGCRVSLVVELELRSHLLQHIVDRVLPTAIGDIIVAFETRASELCKPAKRRARNTP